MGRGCRLQAEWNSLWVLPIAQAGLAIAGAVRSARHRLAGSRVHRCLFHRHNASCAIRLSTSEATDSSDPGLVRVVTYNVLSPLLCSAKRFPQCRPEDLQEDLRWARVKLKIEEAMAVEWPTVICLQEVTEAWAGQLHCFFQQRGWHFTYALTPMTFWQPMGVAMAWPNQALKLEDLKVLRPGGEVHAPPVSKPSMFKVFLSKLTRGRWGGPCTELEPWTLASRKQNRLLAARFRDQSTGHQFVVATYHMPCLFGDPPYRQAKTIHAAILRDAVIRYAGGADLVLAGDFNTKPQDSELQVVIQGAIGPDDAAFPPSTHGLELCTWLPDAANSSKPLRSAYAEAMGEEAKFTNYTWIENEEEPFQETIDYVFVSEHLDVVSVHELPHIEPGDPVYPSDREPSDHVLLAADLRFQSAREVSG